MSDELVHYAVDRSIATVTLDSPPNRNALSAALAGELDAHLTAAADDAAVRAVVLTGAGRAFCVGQGRGIVELDQHFARLHERAVADADGLDLTRFQGLDDLHLSHWLKLALRRGDNVDAAEIGPSQRSDDEGANDP